MTHEYKLLNGVTPEIISKLVNEHLAEGWELWGDPFSAGLSRYCQAVVRPTPGPSPFERAQMERGEQEPPVQAVAGQVYETLEMRPMDIGQTGAGEVVQKVRTLFAGILCACFEYQGDNPECPVHKKEKAIIVMAT